MNKCYIMIWCLDFACYLWWTKTPCLGEVFWRARDGNPPSQWECGGSIAMFDYHRINQSKLDRNWLGHPTHLIFLHKYICILQRERESIVSVGFLRITMVRSPAKPQVLQLARIVWSDHHPMSRCGKQPLCSDRFTLVISYKPKPVWKTTKFYLSGKVVNVLLFFFNGHVKTQRTTNADPCHAPCRKVRMFLSDVEDFSAVNNGGEMPRKIVVSPRTKWCFTLW